MHPSIHHQQDCRVLHTEVTLILQLLTRNVHLRRQNFVMPIANVPALLQSYLCHLGLVTDCYSQVSCEDCEQHLVESDEFEPQQKCVKMPLVVMTTMGQMLDGICSSHGQD